MVVGVPKETAAGERRVALVPETVGRLAASGVSAVVEHGAGVEASFLDSAYHEAGAEIADPYVAEVVCKVQKPSVEELDRLHEGSVLVGLARGRGGGDLSDLVDAVVGKRV